MSGHIIESIGKWGVVHTKHAARFTTPKSGDIIDFGSFIGLYPFTSGKYGRIWTLEPNGYGNSVCCHPGSAFLFENGNVDISGGPFASFKLTDLEPTWTTYTATFWNWGNNLPGGGMGVDYQIERPVFLLKTFNGKTREEMDALR